MKIGCHCVLFGAAIDTDTDEVLSNMAKTGCQGVEIGARFFGLEKGQYLKSILDKHGLVLAGLHTVVPLVQLVDAPEESLSALTKAAKTLTGMPERNIIMTGMVQDPSSVKETDHRLADNVQVHKLAKNLDDIAEKLKTEHDVQLHYHNHFWEFQNDALIYMTLLEKTRYLHMCLDTGWAVVSGYDPVKIMREHPEHFSYVHLRDYSKNAVAVAKDFAALQQTAYVEVGTGDMDYQGLTRCAKDVLGETGWAMLEYETGPTDYTRYIRAVAYCNGVLEGIR